VLGSLFVRWSALVASLGLFGGAKSPNERPAVPNADSSANSGGVNSRVLLFRGERLNAPPAIRVLSDTSLLIGSVVVEFPEDVGVEFNEKGEAVFALEKGARAHSWILKVGKKKLIASATARAIVPLLGVGEPRIEWSRFSFPVPAPRDSLHPATDLKDPFDASPYR
jgi:hypothetical protein